MVKTTQPFYVSIYKDEAMKQKIVEMSNGVSVFADKI